MKVILTHAVLMALTLSAITALWLRGRRPERAVALAILLVMLAPLGLQQFELANGRWALALVSLAFSSTLVLLSLLERRWWLLLAAGVQSASTLSYAIAWSMPDLLMWSGVAFRQTLWFQLMIVALVGAWEPRYESIQRRRIKVAVPQRQP